MAEPTLRDVLQSYDIYLEQHAASDDILTIFKKSQKYISKICNLLVPTIQSKLKVENEVVVSYHQKEEMHDFINQQLNGVMVKLFSILSFKDENEVLQIDTHSFENHFFYIFLVFVNAFTAWSCEECSKKTEEILDRLLDKCSKITKDCLIRNNNINLLQHFLPKLSSATWKLNPVLCCVFVELMQLSSWESLTKNIAMIMPPMLLMLDDYNPSSVLMGLKVCKLMLFCVPKGEMRMYGRGDVLYDALCRKLHSTNAEVLENSLPCILSCLSVLERGPQKSDHLRLPTKYDKIFEIILLNISAATQTSLRFTLWKHVTSFVEVMGITVIRHMKELLSLIKYDIAVVNEKTVLEILTCLQALMRAAWLRIPNYQNIILKLLLQNLLKIIEKNPCQIMHTNKLLEENILCCEMLYTCGTLDVGNTLNKVIKQEPYLQKYFQFL
ncbi:TELO2-interacting protein 2 [Ciona intestinalis]